LNSASVMTPLFFKATIATAETWLNKRDWEDWG